MPGKLVNRLHQQVLHGNRAFFRGSRGDLQMFPFRSVD
jgi:hypothetical protein